MNSKTKRLPYILATISALILLAILAHLFLKGRSSVPSGGIAELTHKLRTVESRTAGAIDWRTANVKAKFGEGDAVKTAEGASALIQFRNDRTIRVEENSLIIIRSYDEGGSGLVDASLEVISGSFEARPGKMRLKVRSSQGDVVISQTMGSEAKQESRVLVSLDKSKGLTLTSFSGDSVAEIDGATVPIRVGEAVTIEQGQQKSVQKLPAAPLLLAPEADEEFFVTDPQVLKDLSLSVKTSSAQVHFQVARDQRMAEMVFSDYVMGERVIVKGLKTGVYYWQAAAIASGNVHGPFSSVASFKISVEPPKPVSLRLLEVPKGVVAIKGGQPVALSELLSLSAVERLVTVSGGVLKFAMGDSSDVTIIRMLPVSEIGMKSASMQNGRYQIDMEVVAGGAVVSLNSQQPLSYAVTAGAKIANVSNEDVAFSGDVKLLFEAGNDGELRSVLLKGDLAQSSANQLPKGAISIASGAPTTLMVDEDPVVLFHPQNDQAVSKFVMSRSPDFLTLEISRTATGPVAALLENGAVYYWRFLDRQGKPLEAHKLSLQKAAKMAPATRQPRVDLRGDKKQQTAYFYGVPPKLSWAWKRDAKAVSYEIELFSDAKLQQQVFVSEAVRRPEVEVVIDAIQIGDYYWRIKYFDYRGDLLRRSPAHKIRFLKPQNLRPFELSSPKSHVKVSAAQFEVRGRINQSGRLRINNESISSAQEGVFKHALRLQPGRNIINFEFTSADGSVTIDNKKIFYESR